MARRFEDIDLSRLGPVPDIAPVDYDAELANIKAGFTARWDAVRALRPDLPSVDVLMLETDPITILAQEVAYRLTLKAQEYNEGVRAVMLASTWGIYLEHRAAEFGLTRLLLSPGDTSVSPAVLPVYESDDELRRRRQMAIEAVSTAGPYGAYIWWAQNAHPQVKQAAVYGPESGLVEPGEVRVVVLDRRGDGTAAPAVLDAVTAELSASSRRPLTDRPVFVQSAAIIPYSIAIEIGVLPGPDIELFRLQAQARVEAHAYSRHKVGAAATVAGLASAASLVDANGAALVEYVTVTSPAADVVAGALQAPYATDIVVTAVVLGDD